MKKMDLKYKCKLTDKEIISVILCDEKDCINDYRDLCNDHRTDDIYEKHCSGWECHALTSYYGAECIICERLYCLRCLKNNMWIDKYGYKYCDTCSRDVTDVHSFKRFNLDERYYLE